MADEASFTGSHDVVRVAGGLVTIETKPGRLARRRSRLDEPVTWPADRTTVTFARTDGSGKWLATFAYEGHAAVLAVASDSLDQLTELATTRLGGVTNTVEDAEAARRQRRQL